MDHDYQYRLIHNGSSDTWHFNQHYLKSVLQNNPNIILNKDYQDELAESYW